MKEEYHDTMAMKNYMKVRETNLFYTWKKYNAGEFSLEIINR